MLTFIYTKFFCGSRLYICHFLQQRALKAKQQHQENLENRRKLAELKLAQMKQVEENRQANTKAISEKAKHDLEKVGKMNSACYS